MCTGAMPCIAIYSNEAAHAIIMRVNANAVLRSWTLLAAFGGSYAPGAMHLTVPLSGYVPMVLHFCTKNLIIGTPEFRSTIYYEQALSLKSMVNR